MNNLEIPLSVIMPVYNEQDNIDFAIEKTIEKSGKFKKFELVVIDDGSTDGTSQKLIDLSMKYDKLVVLRHDKNQGLAQSLKDGFLKASNDYILFNSADLPLNPKDVINMFDKNNKFDLLVIERKKYLGATLWRKLISFCNRIILHIFFPLALIDIADCNFTFIVKKEILKNIFPKSKSAGFIQPEMILRARYLNYNIKSIEAEYNKRNFGKAHFGKFKDILLSLYDIIVFRIYSFFMILKNFFRR